MLFAVSVKQASQLGSAALAAGLALALSTSVANAGSLKVGGTGAAMGGAALLADAYRAAHPETNVEIVMGLGSSGGARAMLAGAIDIALMSRPLRDKESAAGAEAQEYARTPFVIAVRTDNDAENVTLDDLAAIYRGDLVAWPDGKAVRLVLRPKSDSDTTKLASMSSAIAAAVDAAHAREGLQIAATDQDTADAVEKLPGSLSTSTLALIVAEERAMKALALDGVQPTVENVSNGTYTLFKTFAIATGPDLSPEAQSFVDFIWSPEGQQILADSGHQTIQR